MASTSSITTFSDLHPVIIQTQILPRLDGQSLSSVATTSSYLRTITADDILWSDICKSTWLSITHPRINHVISTFSAGHRSFFQDSFQPPTTDVKHLTCRRSWSNTQPSCSLTHHPWPSELILAVDIRFHNNIVYSRVEITDTTTNFLTSELRIVLNDDPARNQSGFELGSIDLKVDKLLHADDETISHLKESVTLNWILIDPTRKRAVNLSSIKPVLAWVDNHVHLRYVIVLPGCDSSERVECRIEVTLVVDKGGVALHVREVILHVKDASCNCLKGKDFLDDSKGNFYVGVDGSNSFIKTNRHLFCRRSTAFTLHRSLFVGNLQMVFTC
ncbi:F-box protein At2g27310 [Lactuca sativa]|nr:F-box protein At2g27310 [Lactuca sativa]